MQIHLAENGNRTGPHSVWSVRDRLRRGELDPATLGWHEGVDNWMEVAKLPAIDWQGETTGPPPLPDAEARQTPEPFSDAEPSDEPEADTSEGADEPDEDLGSDEEMAREIEQNPMLGSGVVATLDPRPWQRLWARVFDLVLWTFLVVAALSFTEEGLITLIRNPYLAIGVNLLYLLAEAALITVFGTTPGKALLGLHVVPQAAGATGIPLGVSLRRTFLVYTLGSALLVNVYITAAAWIFHYISLMKHRMSFWDRGLGTAVASVPVQVTRLAVYLGLFLGMTWLIGKMAGSDWEKIAEELKQQTTGETISPID